MHTHSRPRSSPTADRILPWLLNLASRMMARILNMPEPLMNTTGAFVFAHVQSIENSLGKRLCPVRLLRHFQQLLRRQGF
jgi:hypothetical protein